MRYMQSSYLETVLDPKHLQRLVDYFVPLLQEMDKVHPFDSIAFRGLSGAMLSPILAMKLDKGMVAVRKETQCHSAYQVEGAMYGHNRFIIVDDLVSSGGTIMEIIRMVNQVQDQRATFVGLVLYKSIIEDPNDYISRWNNRIGNHVPAPKFVIGVDRELYSRA